MQNLVSDILFGVKEDIIITQDTSFYNLIVAKVRRRFYYCLNAMLMVMLGWGHFIPGEKDENHQGGIVEK